MDISRLQEEIDDIRAKATPMAEKRENLHQALFDVYRRIGKDLRPDDEKADGLIAAQTTIMRTAATLKALSARELLFKLALWRWDAPDLDQPIDEMERHHAVAYSTFRDLAALLSENTVLTDYDRQSA
jgi:hypothetical protein